MSYWTDKVTIGSYQFPRFIGGPLDGITDSPFRKLIREFSQQECLYTEMRHVGCVAHESGGKRSLNFDQLERPLNFQIAANSEKFIKEACAKIEAQGVDLIDLNIGCPARNVVNSGSGSALMADLPRLRSILETLRQSTSVPFTVKIRAGFKCKNAIDVALLIQDCGAAAIAIHPRLQTEYFLGRPDYALAGQVKKAVSIPVLLSGGIINWSTAKMAYEQTGVDGFLIGRGLWAKPWKLKELQLHAQGESFIVDKTMVITYALKHLDGLLTYYGAKGLWCFRKHLPFYLRGFEEASAVRQKLIVAESVHEVKEGLLRLLG